MMSSAVRIITLAWLTLSAAAFAAEPSPPPSVSSSSDSAKPSASTAEKAQGVSAAEADRGGSRNTAEAESPADRGTGAQQVSPPPAVNRQRSAAARRSSADRLELDTTVVTGNRELPKVLYIVPWKKADIGELPGQPFNTLLDELLTPVDRDVFRREVTYYGTVAERAGAPAVAPATPADGSEK